MNVNSKIYDNAFRTMVEKTPGLIVLLINEMFGTNYRTDEAVLQSRNEHMSIDGEVVTDSVFIIRGKRYHIECQAYDDSTMAIRMVEYDFLVALEFAEREDGIYRVEFPESCVLYIKKDKLRKPTLDVEITFPNGKTMLYQAKAVPAQKYTLDEIFERRLYALLPYYILRYENRRTEIEASTTEREQLIKEYEYIADKLIDVIKAGDEAGSVNVILDLIKAIADYLLEEQPETRKGIGETMGGTVLQLASDAILMRGREEGLADGLAKGMADGLAKGLADGRLEGRNEERRSNLNTVARNLMMRNPEWTKDKAMEMAEALFK